MMYIQSIIYKIKHNDKYLIINILDPFKRIHSVQNDKWLKGQLYEMVHLWNDKLR